MHDLKPSGRGSRLSRVIVVIITSAMALGMLGMAYAAVPLYQMFCRVTGYGGTTRVAVTKPEAVLDRTISIRFDSNVSPELPWTFKPVAKTMTMRIGETKIAKYWAVNNSDITRTGTAAFNVTPEAAGLYFNKIDCFCFTEQVLKPGEKAELPVTFFVDPEILKDKNTRHLSQITLSYTFFPTDEDEGKEDKGGGKAPEKSGNHASNAEGKVRAGG